MTTRKFTVSFFICMLVCSCAALEVPELAPQPLPPSGSIELKDFESPCPVFYGVFKLIPEIASQSKGDSWGLSTGKPFTYALLLPLDQASVQANVSFKPTPEIQKDQILIDSRIPDEKLSVLLFNRKREQFESYVMRLGDGDYSCSKGSLVFPESIISGGGEGFTLNARTHRLASVSREGDFFVYEQISGYSISHKYFIFRKQDSQ